jgi:urease beta subunit
MTIQTFAAGQTLTASQMNTLQASDFNFTKNVQTGTAYTLVATDRGKLLEFSNSGSIALTIPTSAAVTFEIGDRVDVLLASTGTITIGGAPGVSVAAEGGITTISSQWTRVTLIKRTTDDWVVTGGSGEVQTAEIEDGAITEAKLATGAVTSDKILDGTIVNADINASASIVDTKLATISTALKVSNSATTATDANTASAIVARDASGNFIAGKATLATADVTTVVETASIVSASATGTINIDFSTNPTVYYTLNSSANWTLNVRGTSGATLNDTLATGQIATVTFLATNGVTPYRPTVFQVDGSAVTPKWMGGTAPSAGNASSIDAYTLAIIKTGNAAFTMLASQSRFA